jgi:hypothetical protein
MGDLALGTVRHDMHQLSVTAFPLSCMRAHVRACAGASASPWLERDASGPWRFHFTDTQRAWRQEFSKGALPPYY